MSFKETNIDFEVKIVKGQDILLTLMYLVRKPTLKAKNNVNPKQKVDLIFLRFLQDAFVPLLFF